MSLRSLNDPTLKLFTQCYENLLIQNNYIWKINSIKNYSPPKYPIVLCHGLSGFDQLILIPSIRQLINLIANHINLLNTEWSSQQQQQDNNNNNNILTIDYWIGIQNWLEQNGCKVIVTRVPSFGSIENRAMILHNKLSNYSNSSQNRFNIIAHSMGGLDSRYLISRIPNKNYKIMSLTTISTPHHGSEIADYIVEQYESIHSKLMTNNININNNKNSILPICFYQLTTNYMNNYFNLITPNDSNVKYFSYGAALWKPNWYNVFKPTWQIINERSGNSPNDGMVTVNSSKWGEYKGTLYGLDHLNIINWQNKLDLNYNHHHSLPLKIDILQFYLLITYDLAQNGL